MKQKKNEPQQKTSKSLLKQLDKYTDELLRQGRIEKGFYEMLSTDDWDFSPYIESVKTLGKKITIDELKHQLVKAIEIENYELAGKLRNKIAKRKR